MEDEPLAPLPPLRMGAAAGTSAVEGRCTGVRGFRSVRATSRGGGLRLSFQRAVRRPVQIDVFRQSVGRRVIGQRRVARFPSRTRGLLWRASRRVGAGEYFVRFTMRLAGGRRDVRRIALRRTRGRFRLRPDFYRPRACGLVTSFKLERSVFGGRGNRALGIAFRLSRRARVGVEVLRGGRVVRRYPAHSRRANTTHRLRLASERLARGDYQVRLQAVAGGETATDTLTARRL